MKRIIISLLSLTLCFNLTFAQSNSSTIYSQEQTKKEESDYAKFDALLEEFYNILLHETNEEKSKQLNSLIESCEDKELRTHVATHIFENYRTSRIMGEETVAILIYDKWFRSKELELKGEFTQLEAQLFADFNRSSLIGMQAPKIELFSPCGRKITIPAKDKKSVLFFYDSSCAKCQLEAKVLPQVLDKVDFKLELLAVYVGTDRKAWREFRKKLKFSNKNIKVKHLWDPEIQSDYQRLYGVTGTPRMFFIMEDSEILARRLEVENLQEIIGYISLVYGQEKEQ